MQAVVFGKASLVSFTATDRRGKTLAPHSLVSARIYSYKPSDSEVVDDSNTLATAVVVNSATWQNGYNLNEKLIPFPAIADPLEATRGERERQEYWVVVSYRLESGGQIQYDTKSLWVERATGIYSRYNIIKEDLFKIDSAFKNYDSTDGFSIADKIELAEVYVNIDIESKGVRLENIRQEDGAELVRVKAAILAYADLTNQTNDVWERKLSRLEEIYTALQTKISISTGIDGNIDPQSQTDFSTVFISR